LYTRQKEAEAKKFEIQQEAEAQKAKADADRYSREREAQGIQLVGEAEAEAIRAKGVAEAEAMDKKAEAYQKYTGAAVAEMLIKVLPDVAGKIAEPLSKIDKITVIGGNEGNAIDPVAGNVPGVMMKLFESMKETTGIDLGEIVKANTYDAKVTRNVNLSGIPNNETNVYVTPEKAKETKPKTIVKPQPLKKEPEKQPEPVKDEKLSWEK
jgi:flotillin